MQASAHATQTVGLTPRLSIIVATWNAARTLQRCLDSIRDQSFGDWEVLVSDGASTDATVELIRRNESMITWWRSEKDAGIYDAWNQALDHARGEYVCFLGADDAWISPDSLQRLFSAIGGGEFDLVTSRGLAFDTGRGKSFEFGEAWDYRRIGRRMVVCHPGMLHRRELFERYGKFDAGYRIAGDLEFLLRMPEDIRTLHINEASVRVEVAGVSRMNVLPRLREQRTALSRCKRYGPLRAYIAWIDKLWRYPIAKLFDISH